MTGMSAAASAKTERLLNLVIALLSTRVPISKERIRQAVPQYQSTASVEAFDRMFERDKDELRELGIPLVTAQVDPLLDNDLGYRIDRRQYALPPIAFEADEIAALALAGRAWAQATLAGPAAGALRKLRAAGVEVDEGALLGIDSRVRTSEPAFEPLRKAMRDRQEVRFVYRRPGGQATERRVQPWGLVSRRGHWYLTAYDTDRGDQRVFRLARIEGPVRTRGKAGAYAVPPDHEPRVLVDSDAPVTTRTATLKVRSGAAHSVRASGAGEVDLGDGWVRVEVDFHDVGRFADDLAWYGPDVVVESPASLRAQLRERFGRVVAAHGGTP